MRVLVACEYSGTVREAFAKRGHDAWSCDLLSDESQCDEIPNHIQIDFTLLSKDFLQSFDLLIGHPPCTYFSLLNNFMKGREEGRAKALAFFINMYNSPIEQICLENPVGLLSSLFKKPTQIIQPWHFGHPYTKATGLWLKNLPNLKHINPYFW